MIVRIGIGVCMYMSFDIGELLFYGGIGIMSAVILLALVLLGIYKIKQMQLKSTLDDEYGKQYR